MKNLSWLLCLSFLLLDYYSNAQTKTEYPDELSEFFHGLKFRNIGPYRGGRTNAVSGVVGDDQTYYMGTVGGGVFKSTDAGLSWKNITDGQLNTSSVGAIAVSESQPNIIYIGMGEHAIRGVMTSHGDGVYKSEDSGMSWQHMGLPATEHISRIRIHPHNPDIVYVAAQGQIYGPSAERGIYKSIDGGKTWSKILFVDSKTGAADISMDMNNPNILYAAMWDYQRHPWKVRSGGDGSSIHKSTDGGKTWTKLTEGLPEKMGKLSVDVSRANSNIVYANIEADKGGVYKSIDGGKKWKQSCGDRITHTRSWYYMEIYADPQDENIVYVMNAPYLKSIDGGKSFQRIKVPHGDQHDLWINPNNNKNIINSNDGGANVTFNDGKSWTQQDNQLTPQFYRVITDNQFPYRVYAGQQDNSSVSIASRTNGSGISNKDWTRSAGGESAFLAFDENNPTKIYGGSYQGNMSMYDVETGISKDVMAYPVLGLGSIAKDMKYRFNWNSPIVACPQNPNVMYHGANHVLMTDDGGDSWREISPDLTRNDKSRQGPGGEPFTNEGAGGENYNTIAYLAVSPHEAGLLYVGTDDGYIHLTRDNGANWTNITPPKVGELLVNCIEVSPHDPAKVIASLTAYKWNDKTPLVYTSDNYGKSWKKQTKGIASDHYIRAVREDKKVKGLLYAASEQGLYISTDNGQNWSPMQLNLPVSPLNDLTIRDNDLVIATSGRGFWILDDLSSIQSYAMDMNKNVINIIQPKTSVKYGLYASTSKRPGLGQNPLPGVILDYYLPEVNDSTTVEIHIKDGDKVIRKYSSKKDKKKPEISHIKIQKGMNRMHWNMRKQNWPKVKGLYMVQGLTGHTVPPGSYSAELIAGKDTSRTSIEIIAYHKIGASQAEHHEQYAFNNELEATFTDIHQSVNRINQVKSQLKSQKNYLKKVDDTEALVSLNDSLTKKIDLWLEDLIQPKQRTSQDIINFENQINSELLDLKGRNDGLYPKVTQGSQKRKADLLAEWQGYKSKMDEIIMDIISYDKKYKDMDIPVLIIPKE